MTLVFNASPLIVLAKSGLILLAKRKGLIQSVSPSLDAVVAAGLFVTKHHLDAIRIAAGE